MGTTRKALSSLGIVAGLAVGQIHAAVFHFNVNTSSLEGGTEAIMAFDLTNGDVGVAHAVTIRGFTTNGTLLTSPAEAGRRIEPLDADITGTLPNEVRMVESNVDSAPIIISYLQNVSLGDAPGYIGFDFEVFEILQNPVGLSSAGAGEPDGVLFSLYAIDFTGLLTDDGVLLRYSIGAADPCETFSDAATCSRVPDVGGVPEPGALALALAGLLALGVVRSTRVQPLRRQPTV